MGAMARERITSRYTMIIRWAKGELRSGFIKR